MGALRRLSGDLAERYPQTNRGDKDRPDAPRRITPVRYSQLESIGGRSGSPRRHRHRQRVGPPPDQCVPQCREPAPVDGAGAARRTGDQDGARRVPGPAGAAAPDRGPLPLSVGWSPGLAVCAVDVHGHPGALHGRAGRAARHGTRCGRDAADPRPGDTVRRDLRHRSRTARHLGAGGHGAARRCRRHLGRARRIAPARLARRRTGRSIDGAPPGDRPCGVEPVAGARCRPRRDHEARGVCLARTARKVPRFGERHHLSQCPHRTAFFARGRRGRRLGEQAAGQPRQQAAVPSRGRLRRRHRHRRARDQRGQRRVLSRPGSAMRRRTAVRGGRRCARAARCRRRRASGRALFRQDGGRRTPRRRERHASRDRRRRPHPQVPHTPAGATADGVTTLPRRNTCTKGTPSSEPRPIQRRSCDRSRAP